MSAERYARHLVFASNIRAKTRQAKTMSMAHLNKVCSILVRRRITSLGCVRLLLSFDFLNDGSGASRSTLSLISEAPSMS